MNSPPLKLTGRSTSHFTRVARIFALELGVELELEVAHDLSVLGSDNYGGNPALRVPTLHLGDVALFGTDNICRKLAELAGRADDPRVVLTHHVTSDLARSAQEMVWHAMAAQVQMVVGLRLAQLPRENLFFAKAEAGLLGALTWLEERLDPVLAELPSPRDVSVFEVTLFCLLEHLVFRPNVPLDAFPRLRAFAAGYALRESSQRTPYQVDAVPSPASA